MVRLKYCGFTHVDDVRSAVDIGVDAIGINLATGPRQVDIERARILAEACPPLVTAVALFVDADETAILAAMMASRCQAVQLHGNERPELAAALRRRFPVIKVFAIRERADLERINGYPADAYLLDTRAEKPGGSGQTWDHSLLAGLKFSRPVILAGGLNPANVSTALQQSQPWAVDVASGIEASPGRKNLDKMRAFAAACRS